VFSQEFSLGSYYVAAYSADRVVHLQTCLKESTKKNGKRTRKKSLFTNNQMLRTLQNDMFRRKHSIFNGIACPQKSLQKLDGITMCQIQWIKLMQKNTA
jgi:hypothetical protein